MAASADVRDASGGAEDVVDAMDRMNMGDGEGRLGPDGEPAPKTDEEYAEAQLTLRAIVSSKEAGVIIGKGGKNVADLRDETGVKAGVSKVVQGVHDRILTIAGGCEAISKAYAIVAKALLEGAPNMGMGGVVSNNGTHRKWTSKKAFIYIDRLLTYISKNSYQALDLTQPDGYYYWTARP
jgi:heterogeneous nuclear rnp K-like protein